MIKYGVLKNTAVESPLQSVSAIKPKSNSRKKKLVAAVILTSLIDAFSILVIYLLVNFSNSGEILYISKDMVLPDATQSETLKRSTLVKVEKGKYFIEDEPVSANKLVQRLVEVKKRLVTSKAEDNSSLTVQADKHVKYKVLNQVVLAGSHAGFGEIKFAVLAN